ncbi:MAG TPA: permease prefix domain 2-containing transporter, partial [Cyclobacteriaceae bacterium]|nr:permease prefix domain 2-containing transporter [Cyclobacteriaceae bacterium]
MSNNAHDRLLALRFLRWFVPSHLYEGIEGDLLEEFESDFQQSGVRIARLKLAWNVLRFLRPGIFLRNRFSISTIQHHMLKSYFTFAWRSTLRNRSNTVINILGMTCGLGVAIMLFSIVRFEYGFDRFHAKIDRLYQIRSYDRFGNDANSHVPQGVIYTLKKQFPTVEHAAVVYGWTPSVI